MNPSRNDGQRGGDFTRPRRPNPDTIAYLKSLPLVEDVGRKEISHFCEHLRREQPQTQKSESSSTHCQNPESESFEFPSALAAGLTALDEIRQEVASLAGDERGSEVLEILVKITAPYSISAAHKWLSSCQGYVHHLAMHRYGSHVLQTILEESFLSTPTLTNRDGSEQDLALHTGSPNNTEGDLSTYPTITKDDLWDLLHDLQQELLPVVAQLNRHLCATHVLRTLFLILGGVKYQHNPFKQHNPRRGKAKPKKHQGKDSLTALSGGAGGVAVNRIQYVETNHRRPSDKETAIASLNEWVDVISSPNTMGSKPGQLQELACDASGGPLITVLLQSLTYLENPRKEEFTQHAPDATMRSLGILLREPKFDKNSKAGDFAKRILCWQDEEQSIHTEEVVYGMAGDTRGSHVLDTILRLCNDEMHALIKEIGKFLSSLQEYVEHDVSNFVVQTLLATVRTTHVAQRFVEASIPLIESGLILDLSHRRRGILWRLVEMAARYNVGQAEILQALHLQCGRKNLAGILLDPKRDTSTDRLTLNVEGTRALYHLLHFDCPGSREVIEGVFKMSEDDLDALTRDGLGSRCVTDVLFETNNSGDAGFIAKSRTKLLSKLKGRWVSLATDRVGHHAVRKLFRTLPSMKAREQLVQELTSARHRLTGSAMGRSVLSECEVDIYKNQGFEEWSKKVKNVVGQLEWLGELSAAPSKKLESSNDSDHDSTTELLKPSKTRKRASGMTVDSIFDALVLPRHAKKKSKQK